MPKKNLISSSAAPMTIHKDHRPLTALEILRLEWMHADEAMAFLKIGRTKFYDLRHKKIIVPFYIDTIPMYSVSDIDRTLRRGRKIG